uniref:Uncharacterized protein n=1 Tax=Anguilla anguilla TaxID=7936 RepID=A0A0E9WMM2_ANGAN
MVGIINWVLKMFNRLQGQSSLIEATLLSFLSFFVLPFFFRGASL